MRSAVESVIVSKITKFFIYMGIGVVRGDRLRSPSSPSDKSSIARSPQTENYLKTGDRA
ncbi:hypothetical protein [Microcoleus sp. herbarium19]|uniref:hypothetical protein n=1 Tax=Microcoleus sp. herbarium19 TaxID=3055440 RepID=UPI002FCF39E5